MRAAPASVTLIASGRFRITRFVANDLTVTSCGIWCGAPKTAGVGTARCFHRKLAAALDMVLPILFWIWLFSYKLLSYKLFSYKFLTRPQYANEEALLLA